MARRIVLGERADGEYGLFVSATGEDANSSNNLTFDSNATFTFPLFAYGQGTVTKRTNSISTFSHGSPKTLFTNEGTGSGQNTRIAHNLGYEPQVFLRWSYADEIFTNPTGYPSGSYAVTTLSPGRVTSATSATRFVFQGFEPTELTDMSNQIGYGIDFEVDNTYLYISSYEFGFRGLTQTGQGFNFTTEQKFGGITIYYAYIITTAPNNGLKL